MGSKKQARILLRRPVALQDLIRLKARERNTSINSMLVEAIQKGVTASGVEGYEGRIIELAKSEFGSCFVGLLLYGSKARGDAYDTSDTDILVVVDPSVRITRDLYRVWDATLPSTLSINISHLPAAARDAGSLWLECALDARILFDPTGVLRRRLDEIKDLIVSGAFIRRATHGQGYWITT
jgi:predicted nucleotidyltransferase